MKLALAGLIVLLIGDSHIASKYFFNNALHDALARQGAIVHSYGVCGSNAQDWAAAHKLLPCGRGERHHDQPAQIDNRDWVPTWPLAMLIAQHHPDLLIVELGDNMAAYGVLPDLPRQLVKEEVGDLTREIAVSKIPCIWIGPPWGTEGGKWEKTFVRVKELSDSLSESVYPCRYLDSLTFSPPGAWPTIDGVHLTADSYQLWANDLANAIARMAPAVQRP